MRATGGHVNTDPYRAVIDALHAHGRTVNERGDKAMAQCPAHDDRAPSLSIGRGTSQPVVLSCMAGCDVRDVLGALGLTEADICDTDAPRARSELVARYPYVDEHGELLYHVERWEPGFDGQRKSFVQRPANGRKGPGAMDGVRRVLYRLPEVIAGSDVIYVVEGEKDADRLARLGRVATCNAGGAGKWRGEYCTHLHGADVIIVADRDRPGYEHAQQVAGMLQHVANSVSVREPAAGKDVSDHLDAGHGTGDLVDIDPAERLAALADEPQGDDTPATGLAAFRIDWATFWADEGDGVDFLCEPFLVAGRGHALYAGAKTGKSLLTLEAAAAIATGREFLDQPAGQPRVVVYCDYEMTADDVRERLEKYGYGPDDDLTNLHYILLPSIPPLDTVEGGDELVGYASDVAAELVVIDTTGRAVSGEENSADTFRAFYRCTGQRLKQLGVAWLRVDHAGKDKERGQRGSSAKNDDVDYVWELAHITGSTLRLQATHRRSVIGDDSIDLTRHDDGTVPMHQRHHEMWPAGTKEKSELLDALGVPLDATEREARKALKDAGEGASNDLLRKALRWRRKVAQEAVLAGLIGDGAGHGAHFSTGDGAGERRATARTVDALVTESARSTARHGAASGTQNGAAPPLGGGAAVGRAENTPVDNYDEPEPWRPEDEEIWG